MGYIYSDNGNMGLQIFKKPNGLPEKLKDCQN